MKTYYYLLLFLVLQTQNVFGQDSLHTKTPPVFNITSTFKPSILEPTKLPLLLAPTLNDSFKFNIVYTSQYQLNNLKGLPYTIPILTPLPYTNNNLVTEYANDIRIGYGTLFRYVPLIEINIENGNGSNKNMALSFSHQSIRGNFKQQNQDLSNVAMIYIVKTPNRFWNIMTNVKRNSIGVFDFNHLNHADTLQQNKNQLISAGFYVSVSNQLNAFKTTPHILFQYNNSNGQVQEINTELGLQSFYFFSNPYFFSHVFYNENYLKINYDRAWFDKTTMENFLGTAESKFVYKKNFFYGHLGVRLFVEQKKITFTPIAELNFRLSNDGLNLGFGVNGIATNNNLLSLFNNNNFIADTTIQLINTYIQKYYTNVNGSFNNRFYYLLQVGLHNITNQLLYKNQDKDVRYFEVINIPHLQKVELMAEVKYHHPNIQLKVLMKKDAYQNYAADSLWGLNTFETKLDVRVKIRNQLYFNLQYKILNSNPFLALSFKNNANELTPSKTSLYQSLNVSLDYTINKKWGIWMKVNNILNQKNDRWGNYQDLPINFSGGIQYHFIKKPIL